MKLFLAILLVGAAGAQSFDVAVVRKNSSFVMTPPGGPDRPPPPPPPPTLKPTPTGITIENATLRSCLQWAYSVRPPQITGPSWIDENRYDVYAKTGSPMETDQVKAMLRTLLTERFHLVMHADTKESPVIAIVLGPGGSKLKPAPAGTPTGRKIQSLPGGASQIVGENAGLELLEQILSLPLWDPVVDQTGLKGGFNFTFERPPMRAPDADTMLASFGEALQSQLGLRLQPRKVPMLQVVVERGDQNPVEN